MKKEKLHILFQAFLIVISIALVIVGALLIKQMKQLLEINMKYENRVSEIKDSGDTDYLINTISEIQALADQFQLETEDNLYNSNEFAITAYVYGMGDKYANYLSPEDHKTRENYDVGTPAGLGFRVVWEEGKGVFIYQVYEGSAAYNAGIQDKDYIVKVDDQDVLEIGFTEFLKKARGNPGDSVKLTIDRDGEILEFELTIAEYKFTSVNLVDIYNDIAIVNVESFSTVTTDNFIKEMNKLKSEGYNKFIIDLRNNSGGHLETVVKMLDFMVGEGLIVQIKDKNDKVTEEYFSDPKEFNGDIVVLVNENTASASELFAQTMKDFHKGVVVGSNTFGKGTVVTEYKLSNGGTVTLSTGSYVTNSGTYLEGVGVKPDYLVELSEEKRQKFYQLELEEDDQVQKAIEILSSVGR